MGMMNSPTSILAVTAALLVALSCGSGRICAKAANDTLAWNDTLSDGEFLTSSGGNFRLGFFSPEGNSSGVRYVGVWYNNIPDPVVVWVANPQNPVRGRSGRLGFNATGALVIMAGVNDVVWSSGANAASNRSSAQLLDTGNLFVTESANSDAVVWQGFDHPSNTLLPMMQVAQEMGTGTKTLITSWRSPSDPSPGRFLWGLEIQDLLQMFTWESGLGQADKRVRSGAYVNQKFIGMPEMHSPYMNGFDLNRNARSMALSFAITDKTRIIRFVLEADGILHQWNWDWDTMNWTIVWTKPDDTCDVYNLCGEFGVCDISGSPSICSCLRGFEPKFPDQWAKGNWSAGCRRRTSLQCERNSSSSNGTSSDASDGFFRMVKVKSPDFARWIDIGSAADCESWCMRNCSCLAYAYIAGINCVVWDRRLVDVRVFPVGGEDLYLKLPSSELGIKKSKKALLISLSVILGVMMVLLLCTFVIWRIMLRRRRGKQWQSDNDLASSHTKHSRPHDGSRHDVRKDAEYPDMVSFDFKVIVEATDHFSEKRKLGEGGFGSVYKGTLPRGQEIAVKRLSCTSQQGLCEFKNEVVLITKLQHRNLVQLLGCCANEDEKLLIYEFMPNRSLNYFLFDECNGEFLDWPRRIQIIQGIAHGLLYLHRDSRLRIIHRDLKASNVLLDSNMNPKISDFGMARIVGDQCVDNTSRVVGTFGYMAPEYAMQGEFSEKSDVFSFGVLMLEILSGKRINSFYYDEDGLNLLGYAWKLWNEDKIGELIEPLLLMNPLTCYEITKYINVGLLCVQEFPKDRPNMSTVITMFTSDAANLAIPKEPAFIGRRDCMESKYLQDIHESTTTNAVTITELCCR